MSIKRKNPSQTETQQGNAEPESVPSGGRSVLPVSFNTLVEETRQYHEDLERLERLICEEFRSYHGGGGSTTGVPPAKRPVRNTYNARLFHEYTVLDLLQQVQEKSTKLLAIYEDARGERDEELRDGLKGGDVLVTFRAYVDNIHEYFRGDAGAALIENYDESCRRALKRVEPGLLETRVRGLFSGEEGLGRYLDVEELYKDMWCGVWDDFVGKLGKEEVAEENTFAAYLARLEHGHEKDLRPEYKMKNHGKYVPYLENLVEYLSGLYTRANPLKEWALVEQEVGAAFEDAWEGGVRDVWEKGVGVGEEEANRWENEYQTLDALEEGLGGEKIKVILASMGLKCGGTVRQRAERLWSVRGKKPEEIDSCLFAGGKGGRKGNNRKDGDANGAPETNANSGSKCSSTLRQTPKTIAKLEFTIKHLCTTPSLLAKQYKATVEKLEKRHAQTYEEFVADMEAEMEDDVVENVFAGDDDDEEDVHNPLKIPLGFDGKPIPYWMYKLHGLNHEFTCEICGNTTYFGRRQFEKHFTEAKHVAGMKALGIPNSRQFYEITSIAEAVGLWSTIQGKKRATGAHEEEVEDADGNIMSREMLTQMQMQGLL